MFLSVVPAVPAVNFLFVHVLLDVCRLLSVVVDVVVVLVVC